MLFYRGFPLHNSKLHICFQLTSNYFINLFSCYIVVIDYVYANTFLLRFFFHYFIVAQNGGTWVKEEAVLGSTFIFKKFDISINIGKLVKICALIMPLCFCYF